MKNDNTNEEKKRASETLKEAKKVLLISHLQPNGDSVGSMIALKKVLTSLGKNVLAVCSDPVPRAFSYLPGVKELSPSLKGTRDLIIELKTKDVKVESMRYDTADDKLKVIITPKSGEFTAHDVKFDQGPFAFDAVVVLDSSDVASLDDAYDSHRDIFDATQVINIDHHDSNERFGTINYVDQAASSTAEMIVPLVESLGAVLSKESAEALLTGIIADTNGFKGASTSAKTLSTAAHLIGAGADQAKITEQIFGTKSTAQLKIWGRVLARLEEDKDLDLVYSSLTYQDFIDCKASPDQMKGIVDELLSHASHGLIALLIERQPGVISVRLRSPKTDLALKIARIFHGQGTASAAGFDLENLKITEATKEVLRVIRATVKPQTVEAPVIRKEEVRVAEVKPEQKPEPNVKPEGRPRVTPVFDEETDMISEPTRATGAGQEKPEVNVWPTDLDEDEEKEEPDFNERL